MRITTISPARVAIAMLLSAALLGGAVQTARAADLPMAQAQDVAESFHLLTTSAYQKVDPQAVVDSAVAALDAAAAKRHLHLALPNIRVEDTFDAIAALNQTIARAADQMKITPTQAAYLAMAGMANAVKDKYTVFLTPDDFKQFNDALDPEKISGIGVIVGPDQASGYVQASYVVPGTPADRAGIEAGDDFVSIDGVSTKGRAQEDITHMLRGHSGTVVHVETARGRAPTKTLAIVRAVVEPPTVVYRMLPEKVGYLAIFAFGEETPNQFDAALAKVRAAGARALVVDLRNNGGGYVRSALQISSEFISNKALYTVETRGSDPETVLADPGEVLTLPLVVLVNQYSASASEIAAGALQDDGVGTLVGTKTFGKGVMQTVTPFPDGAAIKITTAHYLTPANRDINLRGIEPDVRVDENQNARFGDPEHDAQLRAALAFLEKKLAFAR
jgi:carboxyl-terminal processing protease